ncbi:Thromboxane-A synthase, partial [Teratosphaeria destructans]
PAAAAAATDDGLDFDGPDRRADTSASLYRPPKGAYRRLPLVPGPRFAQVEILAVLAVIFKTWSVELDVGMFLPEERLDGAAAGEKREAWGRARARAERLLREAMMTIITIQMRGEKVPMRLVRRGEERFDYPREDEIRVLDDAQTRLAVRDGRVEVVLTAVLVDGEALEVEVAAGTELRFHGAGDVEGGAHVEVAHAALHDGELDGDDAGHLDGAAEGDLAVALAEVQVADGEFGAGDVDGEVDLAAAREVLDVAVAAVFGAAGDGAGALAADAVLEVGGGLAGVHVAGLRGQGDVAGEVGVGGDELGLAGVPGVEDVGARGAAEDAWVDEAGEFDARDVAGGAVDAVEVPDGFGSGRPWTIRGTVLLVEVGGRGRGDLRLGVDLVEETPSVLLAEDPGEAPRLIFQGLYVLDLDQQDIAGLGGLDVEGTGQVMDAGEVDIAHVVGGVIVLDLAASPVDALDLDGLVVLDGGVGGDWRVSVWGTSRSIPHHIESS